MFLRFVLIATTLICSVTSYADEDAAPVRITSEELVQNLSRRSDIPAAISEIRRIAQAAQAECSPTTAPGVLKTELVRSYASGREDILFEINVRCANTRLLIIGEAERYELENDEKRIAVTLNTLRFIPIEETPITAVRFQRSRNELGRQIQSNLMVQGALAQIGVTAQTVTAPVSQVRPLSGTTLSNRRTVRCNALRPLETADETHFSYFASCLVSNEPLEASGAPTGDYIENTFSFVVKGWTTARGVTVTEVIYDYAGENNEVQ